MSTAHTGTKHTAGGHVKSLPSWITPRSGGRGRTWILSLWGVTSEEKRVKAGAQKMTGGGGVGQILAHA